MNKRLKLEDNGMELDLEQTMEKVLFEVEYHKNNYFEALENKEFDKDDFVETQKQFYYAVTFFSRPMGVLAAKIPTPELRLEIVRNFWEEHGEGDTSNIHQNTFAELLNRMGNVDKETVNDTHLSPYVRIFNTVLVGTCTLEDYRVGVAMMGIIEHMFSDISGIIGRGIIANDWVKEENMIHYNVHETLDIKHSKDFFDVIEKDWNESAHNKYLIKQGLELGAVLFNNLYEDLYKSRKNRY
jgi:hypothetical protein